MKVNNKKLLVFAGVMAVIGTALIIRSLAATSNATIEAENGTKTGVATCSDSNASNGSFIKYGTTSCSVTPPPPPPPPPPTACATRTPQINASSPGQYKPSGLASGAGINATGDSWTSSSAGSYPVYFTSSAGTNLCFYGGNIAGLWNEDTEPWDTYHGAYAIQVHSPGMTFDGVRINNYGDGIGFGDGNSADWTIRNTWISHSHDDCVENDYMHNGLLEDSLLETCFSIISARGHSGQSTKPDGRNNTWTIKNTLMGIYAIKPVYNPSKYPSPGHGGLFKWSQDAATEGYGTKISLSNVIIHLDGRKPNHQDYNIPTYVDSTGKTQSYLTSCSNVKIVWGGELRNGVPYFTEGTAAGTSAASQFDRWPAGCMTFTTDQTVWSNAVNNWKTAHPGVK